jgi:hypothetical protein
MKLAILKFFLLYAIACASALTCGNIGDDISTFVIDTDFAGSVSDQYCEEARAKAIKFGYSEFESWLTTGGDDRSLILESGANKYHVKPQPINQSDIFRG